MKSLKQIINRYIRSAAIVMALVILVVIAFAEILIEQGRVEDTAAGTFVRLEQMAFLRRCLRINPCSLCRMPARTPLRAKHAVFRRVERILEAGTGDTYAVVMIDLDDLKEVNDTYGHESGDQYIISAAEILKKIVGESGLTARHGGDEFVLFLEEKSEEALQEKLLQLKSAQDSSEAVLHDGQHVPLRFSMGCCFIDEVAAPYDEMLEKADIAMYQNKRQRKEKHGKQPRMKE